MFPFGAPFALGSSSSFGFFGGAFEEFYATWEKFSQSFFGSSLGCTCAYFLNIINFCGWYARTSSSSYLSFAWTSPRAFKSSLCLYFSAGNTSSTPWLCHWQHLNLARFLQVTLQVDLLRSIKGPRVPSSDYRPTWALLCGHKLPWPQTHRQDFKLWFTFDI